MENLQANALRSGLNAKLNNVRIERLANGYLVHVDGYGLGNINDNSFAFSTINEALDFARDRFTQPQA